MKQQQGSFLPEWMARRQRMKPCTFLPLLLSRISFHNKNFAALWPAFLTVCWCISQTWRFRRRNERGNGEKTSFLWVRARAFESVAGVLSSLLSCEEHGSGGWLVGWLARTSSHNYRKTSKKKKKEVFLLPFLIKTWNRRTALVLVHCKKHNDKTLVDDDFSCNHGAPTA